MDLTLKVKKQDGDIYFYPANNYDKQKALEKFNDGDTKVCKIYKPRSLPLHGYFFKLCTVAVLHGILEREFVFWDYLEVTQELISKYKLIYKQDAFRKLMSLAFLPMQTIITAMGEVVYLPGSISFDKKDQEEFSIFVNKVRDFVCSEIGLSEKKLEELIKGLSNDSNTKR
jgi:hypothetical protein